SGNGNYTTPTGYTLPITGTVTGTYQWDAVYNGDTNNRSEERRVGKDDRALVSPASPTNNTIPNTTSVTLGTSTVLLKDTADLEGGYHPTGTIPYTLCPRNSISDAYTATLSGNGNYTTPTGYTLPITGTVTGTYQWDAVYNGDTNN